MKKTGWKELRKRLLALGIAAVMIGNTVDLSVLPVLAQETEDTSMEGGSTEEVANESEPQKEETSNVESNGEETGEVPENTNSEQIAGEDADNEEEITDEAVLDSEQTGADSALVMYEILKAGGFTTGGLNFDAKVRRQSTDKYDLFYGHIGAMDTMALALKIAARMIEDGELDKRIAQRYSGWNSELDQQILKGQMSLADLAKYAQEHNLSPVHQSGRQEQLENLVNHYLFDK